MSYSNTSEGMFLGGCSCFTRSCIQADLLGKPERMKTVFREYIIISNVNMLWVGGGVGSCGVWWGNGWKEMAEFKNSSEVSPVSRRWQTERLRRPSVWVNQLWRSTCCWLMKNRCNSGACRNYCTDCEFHTMTKSWLFLWYGWAGLHFEIRV